MQVKERKLKGVYDIDLEPVEDNRGFFMRTYDNALFKSLGLNQHWVQENHSYSSKQGTLRGLHFQFPPHGEVKLVRATGGELFMVFVDLRRDSATLGQWESSVLSERNHKMLYLPEGFALGMCTLTDDCTLLYKMGDYYTPEKQGGLRWDDPDIAIDWPVKDPVLSEKDAGTGSYREFLEKYVGLEV
ncbi:MAG: dTDP-4-dehydrorhamnose 3,5-epimerase [Dehalococcoidales bacterium]|nr:dTDP-4-dehydrorhamnose 3,5-epimerase [Dehalococcoidales bacterium]MDP6632412.1 dTDP-4-dehydrorhamnose 3,5-epimerase [Dehalococcoidales bacterium]